MSFFFGTKQREPRTKKNTGARLSVSAKTKQSAGTLNRLGCKGCPLNKEGNKCEPDFAKRTDIFVLGEAPNAKDIKKNLPFTGEAGKLIEEVLPRGAMKRMSFGYCVMHRPPDDRQPAWGEIESCRNYVVEAIEKAKPKLIIGLGPVALQWVTGSLDMTGLRGRLMAVQIGKHKCWFMATFNPSFVIKYAFDKSKPLQGKMGLSFKLDFDKAFHFLNNYQEPTILDPKEVKDNIHTYNGSPTALLGFKELMDEFASAMKAKKWALDFETYPLRPYTKDAVLLTASISYYVKGDKIHTFAFAIDHPKALWTKRQRSMILDALLDLVTKRKSTKIAHNVPFELEWLFFLYGLTIAAHKEWEDTMQMAHLIDERKGAGKEDDRRPTYQNLNFLTKQYLGFPIKSLFKLDKKDMRKSDIDECLMYNGVDSKYTLALHTIQYEMLRIEKLVKLFNFVKTRQTSVAIMQHIGIPVDQKRVKSFQKKLDKEVKKIENEIQELKVVKQYVRDKGEFNPHSGVDVLAVFKDYLKRTEVKVAGKTAADPERISVDKTVLDKIDHPLAPLIIRLRNRQKLKATYVDEFVLGSGSLIYHDGKIHCNFNTTFTTSGRTSSDEPNMQNFPKREDKWIRGQVKVPKGYVMISIDYGQLEWCLACVCTRDAVMTDATWTGYDVHMVWAEKIAKQWPKLVKGKKHVKDRTTEESIKNYKYARSLVKNKMVFPAIFGAREESIGGYLNMPEDVTKSIFNEFWKTFSGLGTWQKKLMKGYYEDGYVANLFGRKRRYPMTKNEAINHPIQSTAADIVCEAMDRLSMLAIETGKMHLHPVLNIHDDLTFIVPDKEEIIDETIETAVQEMLKLPFDFINVPMSVEVSIGDDWEKQEEIGKFFTTDFKEDQRREQEKRNKARAKKGH